MTDIVERARAVMNDIVALDGDCKLADAGIIGELVAEVERLRGALALVLECDITGGGVSAARRAAKSALSNVPPC